MEYKQPDSDQIETRGKNRFTHNVVTSSISGLSWGVGRRTILLVYILFLAIAATVGAVLQPASTSSEAQSSVWAWLFEPGETNVLFRTQRGIRAVDVSADGQIVWAVGDHGLVARSEDGGRTWRVVRSDDEPLVRDYQLLSVASSPNGAAAVAGGSAARGESKSGVYLVEGGSQSFSSVRTEWSSIESVEWSPLDEIFIGGKRRDSATFIARLPVTPNATSEDLINELKSLSPSRLISSSDQFTESPSSDKFSGYVSFDRFSWYIKQIAYIVFTSGENLVDMSSVDIFEPGTQKSRQGQRSLLVGEDRIRCGGIYRFSVSQDGRVFSIICNKGGTLGLSTDNGQNWMFQDILGDKLSDVSVSRDGSSVIAVGNRIIYFKTNTGSLRAASQADHPTESGQMWQSVSISASGQNAVAVNATGAIAFTEDGGSTWQSPTSYSKSPANWYWISLTLLLVASVRTARQRPSKPIIRSIASKPISDAPIVKGDQDQLGFLPIANGIADFLRNQSTQPPLTVAVTGPWGSGKSSLMALVADSLRQTGWRPVWFNAWHHQEEDELLAALLESLRTKAVPPWWSADGLLFRGRLLWARLRRHLAGVVLIAIAFIALLWGADWLPRLVHGAAAIPQSTNQQAVDAVANLVARAALGVFGQEAKDPLSTRELVQGLLGLPFILVSIVGIFVAWLVLSRGLNAIGVDPARLAAAVREPVRLASLREKLGLRHKFSEAFGDLTRALQPYRLVIVIDDLDRCQPKSIIRILEIVNFLTTSGDCFIIIGMDPGPVLFSIESEYSAFGNSSKGLRVDQRDRSAMQYLEKLINVEVPVPESSPEKAVRLLTFDEGRDEQTQDLIEPIVQLEKQSYWRTLARGPGTWISRNGVPSITKLLRRVVRLAPSVLLWIMVVGISLGIANWLDGAASRIGQLMIALADTHPVESKNVDAFTQSQSGATGSGAPASPGVPSVDPSEASAIVQTHEVVDTTRSFGRIFKYYILPMLLFLTGFTLIIYQRVRRDEVLSRDTPAFAVALRRWVPLVALEARTPRALKRYENGLRYFAMKHRALRAFSPTAYPEIDEATLVALGAMHYRNPDWLQPTAFDRIMASIKVKSQQPILAELDRASIDAMRSAIKESAGDPDVQSQPWPPNHNMLQHFRTLAAGIVIQ